MLRVLQVYPNFWKQPAFSMAAKYPFQGVSGLGGPIASQGFWSSPATLLILKIVHELSILYWNSHGVS